MFFSNFDSYYSSSNNFSSCYRLKDSPNLYYQIELAGVRKEHIKIYNSENKLEIQVNKPSIENISYIYPENKETSFRRTFVLRVPEKYEYESTKYEDGLLTLALKLKTPVEKLEKSLIEW
jgi:HSP20 family molecular chaperone IbpA